MHRNEKIALVAASGVVVGTAVLAIRDIRIFRKERKLARSSAVSAEIKAIIHSFDKVTSLVHDGHYRTDDDMRRMKTDYEFYKMAYLNQE